ncbi:hypothetical protein [Virgibacillus sp. LDC-1]|uniref:hypothetical protein n=1 Tax=Virgibacillus sp. LDC-1 TaxID=3039856 RepID=UPI0024DEEFB1|nr:hypothetical protein [Virgibacillus sp. LDC-1]
MKYKIAYMESEMALSRLMSCFVLLLMGVVFLTGCNDEKELNLKDGDEQITEEMNDVISDYIIQKYADTYANTEKQFEVHKVYGTSEKDEILTVYLWSYYGGYSKATGIENQSGHSLPAMIRLSKKEDSFTVIEYKEPKDGSLYSSSLRKMFPKKYLELVTQDSGDVGELQLAMDKKVKQWLKGEG